MAEDEMSKGMNVDREDKRSKTEWLNLGHSNEKSLGGRRGAKQSINQLIKQNKKNRLKQNDQATKEFGREFNILGTK